MSDTAARPRLLALDALRGLAVFLMIEQHLGVWLWRGPGPGERATDYPVLVGFNALGGGAAPLFVTLAGIGVALSSAAGRPRTSVVLARRGLVLLGFGYLLSFAAPNWFSWGSWFVLHLMGACMVSAALWHRAPTRTIVAAAVLVLVATAVAQALLATPAVLDNARMRRVDLPGGPLRIALLEGQFPLLPWSAFFLLGVVTGRSIVADTPRTRSRLAIACLAAGLALFALGRGFSGVGILRRAGELHLGFYPASAAFVLLMAALVTWAVDAALRWESLRPLRETSAAVTLGRISLTLLLGHVVLFRELTRPVGLWQAMSAPAALATIFGFVAIAAILARAWQRVGYRWGAEWILRRLGG